MKVQIVSQTGLGSSDVKFGSSNFVAPKQSGAPDETGKDKFFKDQGVRKDAPAPTPKPEAQGRSTDQFMKDKGLSFEGGKKKVKESTDNPLIDAFLALQARQEGNIFEASKKLSAKQKKKASWA